MLANEATTLAHGAEAAAAAAETARRTFVEGGIGGDLPTVDVPRAELERGIPAFELFARAGLAASNGEARRLIKGGGARINDAAVADETRLATLATSMRTASSSSPPARSATRSCGPSESESEIVTPIARCPGMH